MNKKSTQIMIVIGAILAIIILAVVGSYYLANKDVKNNIDNLDDLEVYTEEEDTIGYETYTETRGITFKYPETYTKTRVNGLTMYMDPDIPGVTLNLIKTSGVSTIDGMDKIYPQQLKSKMNIQGEVQQEYINLNGNKAYRVDFIAEENGIIMEGTQIMLVKDKTGYVLTLGVAEDDSYEVEDTFDTIIKSLK